VQTSQANLTRTDSFGTTGVIVKIADETQITEHPDVYVQISENCTVYAVWLNKYNCYVAIRKLTPKECFRLQGFSDEYFEKAQFVNSDNQLYKQAGNGVTTNVVRVIADRLAEIERSTENEQL
jgi:DNA (cytosine-5)-methyltransferase 1